jgi:hypothetical protein
VHEIDRIGQRAGNIDRLQVQTAQRLAVQRARKFLWLHEHDHGGMGDAANPHMPVPENSFPMLGGEGPFGVITMGGMFTIVKVREQLASYDDPGWYENPPGTVADRAVEAELRDDGIKLT